MCSICGGTKFNNTALKVFHLATDRGRDYSNLFYRKNSWVCNHRAVPTTEVENPEFNQPFGTTYKVVHNGTIANDKELGNVEGMIDSYVLGKMEFPTLQSVVDNLSKVKGSFAIAILKPNGNFYLACNYKPIFYSYCGKDLYFSSYEEHLTGAGLKNVHKLPPYSAMDMETGDLLYFSRNVYDHAVVVCSSGLDSTAVAAWACHTHKKVTLLHFAYGCIAESNEVDRIKKITKYFQDKGFDCNYYIMPLNFSFMGNSSTLLNKDNVIQEGIEGSEYAYEWVPARNTIMLSLAVGYAEANNASYVYLGNNLEESGAYPDNEPQFIKEFNNCLWGAVQNGKKVTVGMPVGNLMKHEIVKFGLEYDAPFHLTWSCYNSSEDGRACGHCGPCYMRQMAFFRNGMVDPLQYKNPLDKDTAIRMGNSKLEEY